MSTHSSRGKRWQRIRVMVLERDHYTCVYDGRPATTVDHVVPKAKGGTDELTNLVAACARCNRLKSDKIKSRNAWFDPTELDHI